MARSHGVHEHEYIGGGHCRLRDVEYRITPGGCYWCGRTQPGRWGFLPATYGCGLRVFFPHRPGGDTSRHLPREDFRTVPECDVLGRPLAETPA